MSFSLVLAVLRRPWFIAAIAVLAGAVTFQTMGQCAASGAAGDMAQHSENRVSSVADGLSLAGMLFASAGTVLWFVASVKRQAASHVVPALLICLYLASFLMLV